MDETLLQKQKVTNPSAFAYAAAENNIEGIEAAARNSWQRRIPILALQFLHDRESEFRQKRYYVWHAGTRTLRLYLALLDEHLTVNPGTARSHYGKVVRHVIALYDRKQSGRHPK